MNDLFLLPNVPSIILLWYLLEGTLVNGGGVLALICASCTACFSVLPLKIISVGCFKFLADFHSLTCIEIEIQWKKYRGLPVTLVLNGKMHGVLNSTSRGVYRRLSMVFQSHKCFRHSKNRYS